jgi:mRNA interferase MazF
MPPTLIHRGGIYIANLNPGYGTEPGKTRPVVVIQTDLLNQSGHPSTIICPLTTKVRKDAPLFRLHVQKEDCGLSADSDVMIDQIRTIDNKRFRDYLGKLPAHQMLDILTTLKSLLDMGLV